MYSKRVTMVSLLMLSFITTCVWCRPRYFDASESLKNILTRLRRSSNIEPEKFLPFSPKRLEKMLEKAIFKIIMGNLSTSDMILLKSLNYSVDQVLSIRERELSNKVTKSDEDSSDDEDILDAYNRQAVYDYEDMANKMEEEKNLLNEENNADNIHSQFDHSMEPHVIFKIRYDDLDLDSNSKTGVLLEDTKNTLMHPYTTSSTTTTTPSSWRQTHRSFHSDSVPRLSTPLPIPYKLTSSGHAPSTDLPEHTTESSKILSVSNDPHEKSELEDRKRVSEYEGLEWVEDDVYRVIPEALDQSEFNEDQPDAINDDYQSENSSMVAMSDSDYQQDMAESTENTESVGNLSTYQQLALVHRRDQGQKAIEDIKLRVLAMTGRFNLTSNTNQIQRERLTMFSPTCQIPRNSDADVWLDPFSMNMHFQLNLTSGDHVVAAKLRIFKLPQSNSTPSTSSTTSTFEDEEEEEKKIRISIYFYTKSLKKHRSKKRLMDSVVTSLTSKGTHMTLDVREALRYWRSTTRNHGNSNNHGLVIQVEDQDGRPLKPAQYIQQDSCHTEDSADDKAYQRVPALFLQACARYVRVVKGETITYVNCKHTNRNNIRH